VHAVGLTAYLAAADGPLPGTAQLSRALNSRGLDAVDLDPSVHVGDATAPWRTANYSDRLKYVPVPELKQLLRTMIAEKQAEQP
jgi:hypothetical protein